MTMVSIPGYLLSDGMIKELLEQAESVMLELAGEASTPELVPLIQQLRTILASRH